MGVVIPVDYAQMNMRWSVAGDPEFMVCTLGVFDVTASRSPAVVAADLGAAWDASTLTTAANMLAGWSAGTLYTTVMTGTGPLSFETGTAIAGSAAAGTLPNNCAVLVRKVTNLGGRRNRGRMFLPPAYINESGVNQVGTIDPASVTVYQNLVNSLETELVARDFTPVVFHSNGGTPAFITDFVVQPKLATQRTRMRR